jgi:hypothetical protein
VVGGVRTPGSLVQCKRSFTVHLALPRVSGISMDMAVPDSTGQDPALEVEQCTCPPGYRGPSCQVLSGPSSFGSPLLPSPPSLVPPAIFPPPGL